MSAESKNNNPFSGLFQFYAGQAKKLDPIIGQGIDDAFSIYNKAWTEGMKLQSESIKRWTGNNALASYIENAKIFGEQLIQIQKDSTHAIVDTTMKSLLSMLDATKKFSV